MEQSTQSLQFANSIIWRTSLIQGWGRQNLITLFPLFRTMQLPSLELNTLNLE